MTKVKVNAPAVQLSEAARESVTKTVAEGYALSSFHFFSRGGFKLVYAAAKDGLSPFRVFFFRRDGGFKAYSYNTLD